MSTIANGPGAGPGHRVFCMHAGQWASDRRLRWIFGVIGMVMIAGASLFAAAPPKGDPGLVAATTPANRPAKAVERSGFDPSIMEDIDGRKLPPDRQFPKWDVVKRKRPWEKEDHHGTLVVENLRIHDVVNQKAIDIGLWSTDRPTPVKDEPLTYGKVIVRNCEVFNIRRDETGLKLGLHIDFLRICGGGEHQPFETDILVEDVYVHDGTALPILIQEGKYNTITLRRVRIENTSIGGAQLGVINTGHIKTVIVEDCPGLKVSLMGRPGSIENCIVRNSPGARVGDPVTAKGRTGVKIVTETVAGRIDPTTRPVARQGPKPQLAAKATGKDAVHLSLGGVGDDIAFVIFEAIDNRDYRIGPPVVITEGPWEADIKIPKPGMIQLRATITRLGGDPDEPITTKLDVGAAK